MRTNSDIDLVAKAWLQTQILMGTKKTGLQLGLEYAEIVNKKLREKVVEGTSVCSVELTEDRASRG